MQKHWKLSQAHRLSLLRYSLQNLWAGCVAQSNGEIPHGEVTLLSAYWRSLSPHNINVSRNMPQNHVVHGLSQVAPL